MGSEMCIRDRFGSAFVAFVGVLGFVLTKTPVMGLTAGAFALLIVGFSLWGLISVVGLLCLYCLIGAGYWVFAKDSV